MKSFREYITEAKAIQPFAGDEVEHTHRGQKLATGTPIKMSFIRSLEKSPYMGAKYGQDIEPHGEYITPVDDHKTIAHLQKMPERVYQTGEIHFKNPLVIRSDDNDPTVGWKKRLQAHYKMKGRNLSKAIISHGHDGIITVNKYGPSETVNLQNFK